MKEKTKTITAIATPINGQINYISGQSITEANKYVPQYNRDAQQAKEFDSTGAAHTYLKNISTNVHRLFSVITIDILDTEPQLKEPPKQIFNRLVSFLLIASISIASCSKSQVAQPKPAGDKYQLIIEHYTMDTTQLVKRFVWWEDFLTDPKEKIKIDSTHGQWYLMCVTEKMPQHYEYWFYTRNGKKIN